jgi:hypothetical protein
MPKALTRAENLAARATAKEMLDKGFPFGVIHRATGISFAALSRLKNGETTVDTTRGRPTVIPKEVEDIMAKKLERLVKANMSVDLALFPKIARDIARRLKLPTAGWNAGPRWVKGFLKRHPTLSKRKCGKISRARGIHFNILTHTEWYTSVENVLKLYLAKEIFNMDDTGVVIEWRGGQVSFLYPPA